MMSGWLIVLLMVAVALFVAALTAYWVRRRDRKKVAYMLDSLEDGELNFRFVEKSSFERTLNRLRWIFERQRQRNEQESWTKLIRVLTHEIMNTVSPIASLSDALSKYADLPAEQQEMDVKAGLQTISDSSRNLIRFVETYRELSGVARPFKKAVMLDELVDKVLHLTEKQCADAGAVCSYSASSPDILLYLDEGQISQIFINLIKNALQAGATQITITAFIDRAEETHVRFANNGEPISKESQEQIFVPFYTTKKEGSGIGLSISRQIMNQHNGTIDLLWSNNTETAFELLFR